MLALALLIALGPLGLRTQGTLRELFLDMTGADARMLEKPELDLRYTVANTWNEPMLIVRGAQRGNQMLDEQADSLSLRFRAPWSIFDGPRFVWTSIEARLTEHWGGYTDRPIEGWHWLVGAFNYQRSKFERDRLRLLWRDDGGTAIDRRDAFLALGDVVVRTQSLLVGRPGWALAARFDVKIPTGKLAEVGGSGGFDAGLGLVATRILGETSTLHALVALSRFSNVRAGTLLQPKEWHFTAEASLELRVSERWTLLLEDRVLSPLFPPGWERPPSGGDDALLSSGYFADFRVHNQVSVGLRRGRFSCWLAEDFTPGPNPHSVLKWAWVSNSPDVVVGFAFTQSL